MTIKQNVFSLFYFWFWFFEKRLTIIWNSSSAKAARRRSFRFRFRCLRCAALLCRVRCRAVCYAMLCCVCVCLGFWYWFWFRCWLGFLPYRNFSLRCARPLTNTTRASSVTAQYATILLEILRVTEPKLRLPAAAEQHRQSSRARAACVHWLRFCFCYCQRRCRCRCLFLLYGLRCQCGTAQQQHSSSAKDAANANAADVDADVAAEALSSLHESSHWEKERERGNENRQAAGRVVHEIQQERMRDESLRGEWE